MNNNIYTLIISFSGMSNCSNISIYSSKLLHLFIDTYLNFQIKSDIPVSVSFNIDGYLFDYAKDDLKNTFSEITIYKVVECSKYYSLNDGNTGIQNFDISGLNTIDDIMNSIYEKLNNHDMQQKNQLGNISLNEYSINISVDAMISLSMLDKLIQLDKSGVNIYIEANACNINYYCGVKSENEKFLPEITISGFSEELRSKIFSLEKEYNDINPSKSKIFVQDYDAITIKHL